MARTTRPPWTGCGLVLAICTSSLQPPVCATECKYLSGPRQLPCRLHPAYTFTYRLSSTFTASKPSSGLRLRRGFPVGNRSSASWFCLPMLSSFPNPNMYYNCDKFLWKESQRQATKRNVLCLWLSFRMLPTKTDRSPASSAHTPAPAALSNTAVWSQAAQSSGLHFTNS